MIKKITNKDEFFGYLDKTINPYLPYSSIKKEKQKRTDSYSDKRAYRYKDKGILAKQHNKFR